MGNMRTSHPTRVKPLTGFEPAHRVFAELDLYRLATGAKGGEREKYQQKPLTTHRETKHRSLRAISPSTQKGIGVPDN